MLAYKCNWKIAGICHWLANQALQPVRRRVRAHGQIHTGIHVSECVPQCLKVFVCACHLPGLLAGRGFDLVGHDLFVAEKCFFVLNAAELDLKRYIA